MSRSHDIYIKIAELREIRTILNAMKNLAFMETHKLNRYQLTQKKATTLIENTARDFLRFYSYQHLPEFEPHAFCILLGSERGFCGDFNERLYDHLAGKNFSNIIAVGSRLISRIQDQLPQPTATFTGANTAEETTEILNRLIDTIGALIETYKVITLTVLYHDSEGITEKQILPPLFEQQSFTQHDHSPPVLNLTPASFFEQLLDHYLFAILHEVFNESLLAENHQRLQHLEAAVQHLDKETVTLNRKSQTYRQEEITEEIEVILLNTGDY
jgi:F-type H+-transporting ATPase subunit gamma